MLALVYTVEISLGLCIDALYGRARAGASHSLFCHRQFIPSFFFPPLTSLSLTPMSVCAGRVTGVSACDPQCGS